MIQWVAKAHMPMILILKNYRKSLGFKNFYSIKNDKKLKITIQKFLNGKSLSFLEVKVSNNKIKKLPRPTDLIKIKKIFMK